MAERPSHAGGDAATASPSAETVDERTRVLRARAGDRAAQAALFRQYAPKLLALLRRLLGSGAEAEDALQDTFVEALQGFGQLRDEGALFSWLRRIAVHRAQRCFRRRRLLRLLGLDRTPEGLGLEALVAPSASAEVRAELRLLDTRLARLPAAERMAWALRHVEGYELIEVAESQGCSLATAKRRIASAEQRLGRALGAGSAEERSEETTTAEAHSGDASASNRGRP